MFFWEKMIIMVIGDVFLLCDFKILFDDIFYNTIWWYLPAIRQGWENDNYNWYDNNWCHIIMWWFVMMMWLDDVIWWYIL